MVTDAGTDRTGHDADGWEATGPGAPGRGPDGFGEPGFGAAGSRRSGATDLPDARKLAQDWITLWQSEISAMAADPEIRESWQTIMALWAGTMSAMLRGLPREQNTHRYDGAHGRAGPADASRSAAVAPAPDTRDAEIERLARHVAALERRLAELERTGDSPVDPAVNPRPERGRKPRR
jgi:hypothetical protein